MVMKEKFKGIKVMSGDREVDRRCRLVRQKGNGEGKGEGKGKEVGGEGREVGGKEDRDGSALQPAWRRG
jgi:hypothetical protein